MLTELEVTVCQVICDGEPLTLPNDIEGVLFLNINSYMGGVDLWASGVDNTGSGRTGKQSLCDGKLEVLSPSPLPALLVSMLTRRKQCSRVLGSGCFNASRQTALRFFFASHVRTCSSHQIMQGLGTCCFCVAASVLLVLQHA